MEGGRQVTLGGSHAKAEKENASHSQARSSGVYRRIRGDLTVDNRDYSRTLPRQATDCSLWCLHPVKVGKGPESVAWDPVGEARIAIPVTREVGFGHPEKENRPSKDGIGE